MYTASLSWWLLGWIGGVNAKELPCWGTRKKGQICTIGTINEDLSVLERDIMVGYRRFGETDYSCRKNRTQDEGCEWLSISGEQLAAWSLASGDRAEL
jgi:hypothetical protein